MGENQMLGREHESLFAAGDALCNAGKALQDGPPKNGEGNVLMDAAEAMAAAAKALSGEFKSLSRGFNGASAALARASNSAKWTSGECDVEKLGQAHCQVVCEQAEILFEAEQASVSEDAAAKLRSTAKGM